MPHNIAWDVAHHVWNVGHSRACRDTGADRAALRGARAAGPPRSTGGALRGDALPGRAPQHADRRGLGMGAPTAGAGDARLDATAAFLDGGAAHRLAHLA